jgi:cell division protein FtsL
MENENVVLESEPVKPKKKKKFLKKLLIFIIVVAIIIVSLEIFSSSLV